MISKILFEENYKDFYVERTINKLIDLNKVNIFIGENNSGKSRFLRTLFSDKNISFSPASFDWIIIKEILVEYHKIYFNLFDDKGYSEVSNILTDFKKLISTHSFNSSTLAELRREVIKMISNLAKIENVTGGAGKPGSSLTYDLHAFIPEIKKIGLALFDKLKLLIPDKYNFIFENYYIPTLRGLKGIQQDPLKKNSFLHNDLYKIRTSLDYFIDGLPENHTIFTGMDIYEDTRNMLLGKRVEKQKLKSFEDFLSKTFFKNQLVEITANNNDNVLYIVLGDDERAIFEYGDGIQSIILLLFPLFLNQGKNVLFFIEEPELNLHPGMQRIFLETLIKPQFSTFQYFISTHSNHFLDITLDLKEISVYTFHRKINTDTKEVKFAIENVSNNDSRTLDLIGVRSSSIFLSNCTIWVEGITDRLYLKKYLEIYQNRLFNDKEITSQYFEDIHYSFLEYQGSNITHWSFVDDDSWKKINALSISKKIYLLVDTDDSKDNPSGYKAKRYSKLKEHLKSHFRIINGREIENTLNPEIIIKVVMANEKNNAPNVRFDKPTFAEYQDVKLGSFIDKCFNGKLKSYTEESGTIKDKIAFCNIAIENIKTIEDLSEEGLQLAKDIFNFIKESNN